VAAIVVVFMPLPSLILAYSLVANRAPYLAAYSDVAVNIHIWIQRSICEILRKSRNTVMGVIRAPICLSTYGMAHAVVQLNLLRCVGHLGQNIYMSMRTREWKLKRSFQWRSHKIIHNLRWRDLTFLLNIDHKLFNYSIAYFAIIND
jgi:hypothetical protein